MALKPVLPPGSSPSSRTTTRGCASRSCPTPIAPRALARCVRRRADLAVLRTDAKVPPRARTLAIREHDVLLLISPGGKKIKSLAELKKKKIAVLADADNSVTFV